MNWFEGARQFHATRAHAVDVGFGRFVTVCKGALLFRLAPEHFVVAVRVERRIDVNQIHAGGGQFLELLQIIAAINYARVHDRRGF